MTRRLLLLLPMAACLRADSAQEIEQLIADAVSGLSAGKPEVFLAVFDKAMPGFERLGDSLVGLMARMEIGCGVDVLSNEGDDEARVLTLNWILRMDGKDGSVGSSRREKTLRIGACDPSEPSAL